MNSDHYLSSGDGLDTIHPSQCKYMNRLDQVVNNNLNNKMNFMTPYPMRQHLIINLVCIVVLLWIPYQ